MVCKSDSFMIQHLTGAHALEQSSIDVTIVFLNKQTNKQKQIGIPLNPGTSFLFRACLHGGGGPQVGEVTRLGGVTRLSI